MSEVVKHWRVTEDRDGWWWLVCFTAESPGVLHSHGRIFGRFLAERVAGLLNAEETIKARAA